MDRPHLKRMPHSLKILEKARAPREEDEEVAPGKPLLPRPPDSY